jgi:anti-anti-sigma factor
MSLFTTERFTPNLTLSTRLVSEMGDSRSTLRATTDRDGPAVLIHAGGEIDAHNEQTWRHLVSEAAAAATPPGPFVVDVTGVDFMACCAFSVLADEAEWCRRRGVELRLVSRQPIVARIVKACGLTELLPVFPSVEVALAETAA